ncbi:MAG TPA: 50S ribosomal protein L13 [Gammaproteobacteria bacterium]|jgi:large subunit ribosomal protein L13|uniref:50S ribosomal protein L13 n=1 Tax=marine metagenome TaxID=408172 RepID=A0A381S3S9_9ZZZZ|nr:50S ribosomal protein L13 [SAR86 cluster bacterium]HHZ85190.1 50S ribosomal protein L13 [Gammaproteobacteria bacterium]HIA42893.1 50S ribosomal protein L13 [Gammaproteobacteria bacterium]HIB74336.1 50S ribosomal protein L13 [Gammaproteobacteria bacterium]HIG49475.1 50S ribosomal protein L13 [Gammaproteobacteria bacterium]|tara:strand:+ start:95 stop:523 length:429 start_codon:yes stop_codon:yes gene_type:complete
MITRSFKQSDIKESWILVDAEDKTLGRLASSLASRLRGKHRPEFTPNADLGDYIVVVNAGKISVTGDKLNQKKYYKHSGYPGGIKSKSLDEVLKNSAEDAIRMAVKGMLPKNKLGKKMLTKLKIYKDAEHPHQAQNPSIVDI